MPGKRYQPERLQVIEQLLARMTPHRLIEEKCAHQWGVTTRQVRRYIAEIHRQWAARAASTSVEDRRAQLTEMAMDTYRECRSKGHARTALACIAEVARLQGVTVNQLVGIGVFNPNGAMTSDEAVKQRLAELRAKQLTGPQKLAAQIADRLSDESILDEPEDLTDEEAGRRAFDKVRRGDN